MDHCEHQYFLKVHVTLQINYILENGFGELLAHLGLSNFNNYLIII